MQHVAENEEDQVQSKSVEMKPISKYPAVFRWNGTGEEVAIAGSFNSWRSKIPLVKRLADKYLITGMLRDKLSVAHRDLASCFSAALAELAELIV